MKTLREALFNKKNLDKNRNPYGITENDMIGDLKGYPVGVVVRMMEEQRAQTGHSNVKVFQDDVTSSNRNGGFAWDRTRAGNGFWEEVIGSENFDLFFKNYPEYEKYN